MIPHLLHVADGVSDNGLIAVGEHRAGTMHRSKRGAVRVHMEESCDILVVG